MLCMDLKEIMLSEKNKLKSKSYTGLLEDDSGGSRSYTHLLPDLNCNYYQIIEHSISLANLRLAE